MRINQDAYYRIRGTSRATEDKLILWIDKQTFLVRKIFETSEFPDFSTKVTTTYKPRVNTDIPAKEFTFEPPEE